MIFRGGGGDDLKTKNMTFSFSRGYMVPEGIWHSRISAVVREVPRDKRGIVK